jgi:short-subunit dehydrogenase
VTRDQVIAKLADAARRHGRAVTVVVANAGVAVGGQFEHIPAAEWQRILEVNVIGVVRTINAFLPGMLDRADGVVAITSSVQGLISESPTMTPYVTTKAALVGLARSLASYTRPRGVNTVLLCPSLTRTAFPNSARMWGPAGAATRSMNLPDWADTPEQVAELLIATLRADTFLASAVADLADRLHAWASDPDAALPSAPPSAGGAR